MFILDGKPRGAFVGWVSHIPEPPASHLGTWKVDPDRVAV